MDRLDANTGQLIAEGSSKLASVPSGGAGGSAPAAGGAAASGGAAEAAPEEEKEEGMSIPTQLGCSFSNTHCREGGVRRGHGFRSFRLSNSSWEWNGRSGHVKCWAGQLEGVVRACESNAFHGSKWSQYLGLFMNGCQRAMIAQ